MDVNQTSQTLDALAHLFLTGKHATPDAERKTPSPASDDTPVGAHDPAATNADPAHRIKQAEGPPAEKGPRRGRIQRWRVGRPYRDIGPRALAQSQSLPGPAARRVEAVFLGNLPGFGGPWLTQYAHHLAQQVGPVVVLHVDEEQVDLELVGTDEHRADLRQLRHGVSASSGDGLIKALKQLDQSALAPIGAWLVHLPMPLTDSALEMAGDLDRWTLLCGADDAAAVGAYRLLKQLCDPGTDQSDRTVGLMVMGSDQSRAHATSSKLAMAARGFLKTPVHLLGCREQMQPLVMEVLGSFHVTDGLWGDLMGLLGPHHSRVDASDDSDLAAVNAAAPTAAHSPSPSGRLEAGDRDASGARSVPGPGAAPAKLGPALKGLSADPPVHEPAATASFKEPFAIERTRENPQIRQPAGQMSSADHDDNEASPADDGSSGTDLSRFLTGTVPLAARCPRQQRIQIVLDENSRLHVLAQHDCGRDISGVTSPHHLGAVLMDLLETRVWVIEHLELLKLTQKQCRFDEAIEPTLHLFTDHAKSAAALAARIGGHVKLHLLQRIHISDQSTWFCTDIN